MAVCCFTGHRPNKLGGYNYASSKNKLISEALKNACIDLIENQNVDTFVVGGALGIDQMAFEVCYELKAIYDIKIIVAIPFKQQDFNWPDDSSLFYKKQLKRADELVYVDTLEEYAIKGYEIGVYYPAKMQKRNEYMVDVSDFIVTYFDGTKGGTKNCLDYWCKKKSSVPINVYDKVNK